MSGTRVKLAALGADIRAVALKIWHLGAIPLVAVLAFVYLGYLRTSSPATATTAATAPATLAQKDATIQTLRTKVATLQGEVSALQAAITALHRRTVTESSKTRAALTVRRLIPSIESYNADNVPGSANDPDPQVSTSDSGYAGMTIDELRSHYDQAIPDDAWVSPTDPGFPVEVAGVVPTAQDYCAVARVGGWYAWKLEPAGSIWYTQNSAAVCQS